MSYLVWCGYNQKEKDKPKVILCEFCLSDWVVVVGVYWIDLFLGLLFWLQFLKTIVELNLILICIRWIGELVTL